MKWKFIGFTAILLLLILPINAFAEETESPKDDDGNYNYRHGLLDDGNIIDEINLNENIYDNDLNTKGLFHPRMNKKKEIIKFKSKVNLDAMYIKNGSSAIDFEIYADNQKIYTKKNDFDGYVDLNVSTNVLKILVSQGTGSASKPLIYELDFFGSYGDIKEPDPEPSNEEVKNVKVKPKQERVDLSWDLPKNDDFHHVNIYRKDIKDKEASAFNKLKPMTVHADDGKEYKPIFETNGTYFNDLSVESASKYDYKLKTEDKNGDESKGINVKAKTPKPKIEGGQSHKKDNGDYEFKWDKPTKGDVNIIVGGKKYDTVKAKDNKFIVPKKDMSYTSMGDPDVGLQPVAPNGTNGDVQTGSKSSLKDITMPFDVKDLIKSGNNLILLIGSFVLLSLSFIFVPKIIKLIRSSIGQSKGKEKAKNDQQRETRPQRIGRNPNLTKRQRKGWQGNGS